MQQVETFFNPVCQCIMAPCNCAASGVAADGAVMPLTPITGKGITPLSIGIVFVVLATATYFIIKK